MPTKTLGTYAPRAGAALEDAQLCAEEVHSRGVTSRWAMDLMSRWFQYEGEFANITSARL
jgi:hypothetical protein